MSGARRNAYVLMRDKIGRKSLSRNLNQTNYMRITNDLPEVDVPKGTLVEIDVDGFLNNRKNPSSNCISNSVSVVCIDDVASEESQDLLFKTRDRDRNHLDSSQENKAKIKFAVTFKELFPVEHEACELLLPLAPSARYTMVSSPDRLKMLASCRADGQTRALVRRPEGGPPLTGLIQFVGPIPPYSPSTHPRQSSYASLNDLDGRQTDQPGAWIGLELLDRNSWGECDGTVNGVRLFKTRQCGAIFVTVDQLYLYEEEKEFSLKEQPINATHSSPNKRTTEPIPDGSKTVKHQMALSSASLPIKIDERIVWLTDEGPRYGTVKWTGKIEGQWNAGVDFVSF